MNEQKSSFKRGILLITFGVVLYSVLQNLGAVVDGWKYIWGIVQPIVLGLCMAFVFNVLMVPCERRLGRLTARRKRPPKPKTLRAAALILTLLIGLGIIALTMVVIIPKVSEAVGMFISDLPQSSKELSELLGALLTRVGIDPSAIENLQSSIGKLADQVLAFAQKEASAIAGAALNMTSSLLNTITDLVFGLIIAIYVLLDKERIGRFVQAAMRRFLPKRACDVLIDLAELSYATFSAFVRGQFLEALILGLLCFVGMLIFRFPYAAAISLLIGVTALIPIIGAWIGGIISAFLVLLVSPIKAVLLVVFIIVLQQLEGDLIYPRVVGSTIGLPGLLVLVAVIVGQGLMGVFGILISVPLTAVLYTVVKRMIYENKSPGKSS